MARLCGFECQHCSTLSAVLTEGDGISRRRGGNGGLPVHSAVLARRPQLRLYSLGFPPDEPAQGG